MQARAVVTGFAVGVGLLAVLWLAVSDGVWPFPDAEPAPGARLAFTATAYCKGTTTASGINVRRGIAAADPALLPAGTVVSLSTGDEDFDGVYTVLDTGPLVQGRRLDLYVWSCTEALAFGHKDVEVTILRLGWNPKASAATLVDRLFRLRDARRARRRPTAEAPSNATPAADPAAPNAADTPPPASAPGEGQPVAQDPPAAGPLSAPEPHSPDPP